MGGPTEGITLSVISAFTFMIHVTQKHICNLGIAYLIERKTVETWLKKVGKTVYKCVMNVCKTLIVLLSWVNIWTS